MSPLWDTQRPECPHVSSVRFRSAPICPGRFATDCSGGGPRVQNPYAIPGFATNPQPAGRIHQLLAPLSSPMTLSPPLATGEVKKVATRAAYGEALLALGGQRDDVVVFDADLSGSTKTKAFGQAYPDRFFNFGVSEANMMGTAAGLASLGQQVVFASSFAMFATGKAWEQLRQCVCVPNLNVKVCATHAGLTVGEDGKSHQMLEDIALMRVIPNMKVIVPADATEAKAAVMAAVDIPGPVYIRLSRAATRVILGDDYRFKLGRGTVLRDGTDLAICACGVEVAEALDAAELLFAKGIYARVINLSTVDPMDEELVAAAARECGAILTVEEHQIRGGLGDAVAQAVVKHCPVPMEMVGMDGEFGQSGPPTDLLTHYGLDANGIAARAQELLQRKG
jgi:transketolase